MATNNTDLSLISTIFKNVLKNPKNAKYRNLNINRIRTKFTHPETYMQWLFNAGFYESNDRKRLLLPSKDLNQLIDVYNNLQSIMELNDLNRFIDVCSKLESNSNSSKANDLKNELYKYQHVTNTLKKSEKKIEGGQFSEIHLKLYPFDNHFGAIECKSANCDPLGRICLTIQLYHQLQTDFKQNATFDAIFTDGYNEIYAMNDFHHLLLYHGDNYEVICQDLFQICKRCSLTNCKIIKRNCREKLDDDHNKLGNLDVLIGDTNVTVQQAILDKLHCYIFHSFDVGYNIEKKDRELLINEEVKKDANDCITFNKIDAIVYKLINTKRRSYEKIQGLERIKSKNSRYNTNIEQIVYDHGIRFFYWDYYKNANEVNDVALLKESALDDAKHIIGRVDVNRGYSTRQWYIKAKYTDLKAELLNNTVCSIPQKQWDHLLKESFYALQTEYSKKYISREVLSYNIKAENALTLDHLAAMMTYCNYDMLQAQFSETYRRRVNESDDELKTRHSNFAHLGRLLREFCECFGQHASEKTLNRLQFQPLWHGISQQTQFATINPHFNGPFSSTKSFCVAVNFCGSDGCVLQFSLNENWLFVQGKYKPSGSKYNKNIRRAAFVDCGWLSNYPNEQEWFFIGGFNTFHIDTIIMQPDINYEKYIIAMGSIFDKLNKNSEFFSPIATAEDEVTNQIAYRILSNEFSKYFPDDTITYCRWECPKYIDRLFHNSCNNLRSLTLFGTNIVASHYNIDKTFDLLDAVLFDENKILKFDTIIKVFPSVEAIHIETNCFDKKQKGKLGQKNLDLICNPKFWDSLLKSVLFENVALGQITIDFGFLSECEEIVRLINQQFGILLNPANWRMILRKDKKLHFTTAKLTGYILVLTSNDYFGRQVESKRSSKCDYINL
eukprot:349795_1